MKLSSDNLLSHETLHNLSSSNVNVNNDSPRHHNHLNGGNNQSSHNNRSMNKEQTPSGRLNGQQSFVINSNLLQQSNGMGDHCDSPSTASATITASTTTTNATASHTSTRLSTHNSTRNGNMSNNNLSTSASLLDATTDDVMSVDHSPFEPAKNNNNGNGLNSASSNNGQAKKMNKRAHRVYELYETEKRFVNILHTIIYVSIHIY